MAIGIFDSGFGGLTVLRAIQDLLPNENCVYFGDTARLPYGNKSPDTIRRYCLENLTFLLSQNIKILVIACNTACASALDEIQKICPIPVIGVIEPGVEAIIAVPEIKQVAILGTRATIASKAHENLLKAKLPHLSVMGIACPLFVPLVEEGYVDHPLAKMVMYEYLRPLKEWGADTILLACTHYPLLENDLRRELGSSVRLVNPAENCAKEVERQLKENSLLNPCGEGKCKFYASDDPEKFRFFGPKFLHREIEIVGEII